MPNGSFGRRRRMKKTDHGKKRSPARRGRSYPLELKLRVIREIESGQQTVYGDKQL